jgi:peptide-methionine (R)-S-oxide reductase
MKFLYLLLTLLPIACQTPMSTSVVSSTQNQAYEVVKTDDEWRKQLSAEEFHILREAGTERAFSGQYWDNHEKGIYVCRGCDKELFDSKTKFDSGTGWPSFYEPISKTSVENLEDNSYGMSRTEVRCARCGGHLGHVFDDGPAPTGKRYCMNSASMKFLPAK